VPPVAHPEQVDITQMGTKMKKVLAAIIIIVILTGIIERDVVFQEGNPVPLAFGILKLNITDQSIVKISASPDKYIIRSRDGDAPYIKFMEENGWKFVDQLGAGLVFEKNGEKHISVSRMFTRFYKVIMY